MARGRAPAAAGLRPGGGLVYHLTWVGKAELAGELPSDEHTRIGGSIDATDRSPGAQA